MAKLLTKIEILSKVYSNEIGRINEFIENVTSEEGLADMKESNLGIKGDGNIVIGWNEIFENPNPDSHSDYYSEADENNIADLLIDAGWNVDLSQPDLLALS